MSNFDDILCMIQKNHTATMGRPPTTQQFQPQRQEPLQSAFTQQQKPTKKLSEVQLKMLALQEKMQRGQTSKQSMLTTQSNQFQEKQNTINMQQQEINYENDQIYANQLKQQSIKTENLLDNQFDQFKQQIQQQQNQIDQLKQELNQIQKLLQQERDQNVALLNENENMKQLFQQQLDDLEQQIGGMPSIQAKEVQKPEIKQPQQQQQTFKADDFNKQWEQIEQNQSQLDSSQQNQLSQQLLDKQNIFTKQTISREQQKQKTQQALPQIQQYQQQQNFKVLFQHNCLKIMLPEQTQLKEAAAKRIVSVEETIEGNIITWSRQTANDVEISGAVEITSIINVLAAEDARAFRSKVLAARKAGYIQDIFELISTGLLDEIQPKTLINSQCSLVFFTQTSIICFDFGEDKDQYEQLCAILVELGL